MHNVRSGETKGAHNVSYVDAKYADIVTEGNWCFVVLWVKPFACESHVHWPVLKQLLEGMCPAALAPCWSPPKTSPPQQLVTCADPVYEDLNCSANVNDDPTTFTRKKQLHDPDLLL